MYKTYKKISLLFSIITFVILFSVTSFSDTSANVVSEGTIVTTDGTTGNFGWVEENGNWRFIERDGEYAEDTMKKSNNNTYYIDENGYMAYDYLYTDDNNNTYYFSDTGAMVTHLWVAISPDKLENEKWNAEYFYMYFQDNGKAIKGKEGEGKKKTIEGKTYFFDEDGVMLTGWISKNGEHMDSENSDEWYGADSMYFALDDGSLAEGWLKWQDTNREGDNDVKNISGDLLDMDVMWFYFEPKSHKKVEHTEKSINGQKYRFEEDTGRMYMQWEETEKLLPYIRLEYIESTGNQCLDTGVIPTGDVSWELDTQFISPNGGMGAARNGVGRNTYMMICSGGSDGHVIYYCRDGSMPVHSGGAGRHTVYLSNGIQKIDGVVTSTDARGRNMGWNIYLFAYRSNGAYDGVVEQTDGFCKARVFGTKIWKGDKLVKNFIPVKMKVSVTNWYGGESAQWAIGLWDLVEEKFYPQKQGDDFIPGPEIKEFRHNGNAYDGSLARNEWVFDVPSPLMSQEKYESGEKEWFLADSKGYLYVNQEKKINNKTYLFDANGIMQKSLIVKYKPSATSTTDYIMRVDLDSTTASDFIKKGEFYMKDEPSPNDSNVPPVAGEDPLFRENCIKGLSTGNYIAYNIFYFGEDGAKRVGNNINIAFGDENYIFSSKSDGATYGFHNRKYYSNGFLCTADKDIGYGILVDYNVFNIANNNITKSRKLDPAFFNYNNFICNRTGTNEIAKGNAIASAHNDLNKYYVHYPITSILSKGYSDVLSVSGLNIANKKFSIFVVDSKGKRKKKGRYLDRQGNHWLIDKNQELVGIFTVPVKWGTVNGEDTPMYKSSFYETRSNSEQVEKEKYMPFFTKDINGNTELDYVYDIDDSYIVNATIGDYKMGMN